MLSIITELSVPAVYANVHVPRISVNTANIISELVTGVISP